MQYLALGTGQHKSDGGVGARATTHVSCLNTDRVDAVWVLRRGHARGESDEEEDDEHPHDCRGLGETLIAWVMSVGGCRIIVHLCGGYL